MVRCLDLGFGRAAVSRARSLLLGLGGGLLAVAILGPPAHGETGDDPEAPEEPWMIRSRTANAMKTPTGDWIHSYVGAVVITHGDLTVTADEARYFDRAKRAVLSGHVEMRQDSTVVRGPVVSYDRIRRIAHFPRGVLIERPTGTALADLGTWRRDENEFELRGEAAAADTAGTLDANAMTYDDARNVFYAVGDARMVDHVSGVLVEGQNLRWDRAEGLATATGAPEATFEEEDGVPVRVWSERMTYDPADQVAVATGDVRIEGESMEGHAETATFYRAVNRAVLTGDPEIVDGSTVVNGDRIEMDMPEPGRRIVRVTGSARVANRFLESRSRPEAPEEALPAGEGELEAAPDVAPDVAPPEGGMAAPDAAPESGPEAAPADTSGLAGRIERARTRVEDAAERIRTAEPPSDPDEAVAILSAEADSLSDLAETAREAVEAALAPSASSERGGEAEAGEDEGTEGEGDDSEEDEESEDEGPPLPPWLTVPSEQLPTENLLFGDRITIHFLDDEIRRVEVVGYGRSKFFPNEEQGELTEWNDVSGDTLFVWFAESAVESVTVLGNGEGEYRLPAGEEAGSPTEVLAERGKLVRYRAPRIRYNRTAETMHLDQGAEVRYKTMNLKSGRIDFEAQKEIMTAGGDPAPILVDVESEILGEQMNYHLPTQKGEITYGKTKFENAYYRGEDIWKMGEDVLAVHEAVYTTCDRERPHYHFASRNMKIYLDDKVVAKPVVLKIHEIPVFALPFYMASLKKSRHSGFLLPNLELGVDDNRGRFIRKLGYFWAPNDYMDLTTSFDFYPAQDRIVTYLNGRYKLRYRFEGRATMKYNRDVPNNLKDTALELEHRQSLSETMTLNGSARFVSTSSIYRDIDDDQRLNRDLRSHATFTKNFPGSNRSLRAEVERRENLDTGQINETLPLVAFSQPSRPLSGRVGRSGGGEGEERKAGWLDDIYYNLDSRFVSLRTVDQNDDEDRRTGAKTNTRLTVNRTPIPYLQIRPSASGEVVWVNEDRLGKSNATRATYSAAVSADTKLYGTFLRPIGPSRGLRHVIEPRISWNWAPDFREYFYRDENGNLQDRFASFGGIGGTTRKTSRMSMSLNNLVQSKIDWKGEEKRFDVFSLGNSISYDFLAEDEGRRPLSNLTSSLRVLSSQSINQTWSVSHDVYNWDLLSSSVTTRIGLNSRMFQRPSSHPEDAGDLPPPPAGGPERPDDPFRDPGDLPLSEMDQQRGRGRAGVWRIDLSHTARRGGTSNVVWNSDWSPTERWNLRFMTEYDLQQGENTRQEWSVQRTIHCWQLAFDRRLLGGEWQYYLRINVTDLPDIQAERGDRFRGRRSTGIPGSGLF
jgi:lipopolysaccharide assembly outer membrane protein LptD (OstA)